MASNKKVEVSAADIKNSQNFWVEFTKYTKISIIALVILMALLALFLV